MRPVIRDSIIDVILFACGFSFTLAWTFLGGWKFLELIGVLP